MGTKVWVTILIGTILCFGLLLAASASYGNWLPLTNIVFLLFAPLPIVLGGILKGNDTYGSQLSYVSLSMTPPTYQTDNRYHSRTSLDPSFTVHGKQLVSC